MLSISYRSSSRALLLVSRELPHKHHSAKASRAAIAKHLHCDRELQITQVFVSSASINRGELGLKMNWIVFLQFSNGQVKRKVDGANLVSGFTLVDIKILQRSTHRFPVPTAAASACHSQPLSALCSHSHIRQAASEQHVCLLSHPLAKPGKLGHGTDSGHPVQVCYNLAVRLSSFLQNH